MPRQLCKHPLHKFTIGPSLGKRTHVFEITREKPLHIGKCRAQITRQQCRSAVRFAARPLMRSHGDRGNEKSVKYRLYF